jgi:hypothetical protein
VAVDKSEKESKKSGHHYWPRKFSRPSRCRMKRD